MTLPANALRALIGCETGVAANSGVSGMIGATICSGVGAPECAAPWVDWLLQSEVAPFPRAVLQHGFGAAPAGKGAHLGPALWGDFTALRPRHFRRLGIPLPDIIVAGTPCQAFSVAGARGGTADPRGNLTLAFVRTIHAIANARPDGRLVVLWENVPGVLSDSGNAFGCFLGGIVGAVDALVPGARPAAGKSDSFWKWSAGGQFEERDDEGEPTGRTITVEPGHRLTWPSEGMVQGPRARAAWSILDAQWFGVAQRRRRVFLVVDFGGAVDPAAVLLEPDRLRGDPPPRRETRKDLAPTIAARPTGGGGRGTDFDLDGGLIVAAFGGNNTKGPIDVATAVNAHGGPAGRMDFESETFIVGALCANGRAAGPATQQDAEAGLLVPICFDTKGTEVQVSIDGTAPTLRAMGRAHSHQNAGGQLGVVFDLNQITSKANRSHPRSDVCHTIPAAETPPHLAANWAVRRLTPTECERLQGLPDDHTLVTYRGKPASDGPRYKAIGNSMAVPVVRWIMDRIRLSRDAMTRGMN